MSATPEDWKRINAIFDEGYKQLAADLGYPGWIYRDLPHMSHKLMDELIDLAGSENIHWIAFAESSTSVRGQVLFSPEAVARMNAYSKGIKDARELSNDA